MFLLTCDCCGCHPEECKTFGFVNKKEYCPECSVEISNHMKAIDDLHTELSQMWSARRLELINAFKEKHPKARLPDD